MDLAHGRVADEEERLDELDHLDRVLQGVVRGRVLLEDVEEFLAIGDHLRGWHRGPRLADEVLLARGADEVVVLVAEADVLQRLEAAETLVAGLDVDLRDAGVGRDVVAAVDVDVDAVDRIDGVGEAGEVDVDDVVDVEPGEPLDDLQGQLRPTGAVGGVELVDPDPRDVDPEVAGDRHQGDRVAVRVDVQQDRRVRAARVAGALGPEPFVGAEDEDVLRLAAVGRHELLGHAVDPAEALGEVGGDQQHVHRGRRRHRDHDHHRGGEKARPQTLGARRLALLLRLPRLLGLGDRGDRGRRFDGRFGRGRTDGLLALAGGAGAQAGEGCLLGLGLVGEPDRLGLDRVALGGRRLVGGGLLAVRLRRIVGGGLLAVWLRRPVGGGLLAVRLRRPRGAGTRHRPPRPPRPAPLRRSPAPRARRAPRRDRARSRRTPR